MRSYIKSCAVGLLFVCILPSCFAEDVYASVFALAQRLEQSGAQKEAATEYKRYLFLQDFAEGLHQAESYDALARYYQHYDETLALEYIRLSQHVTTDVAKQQALQLQEIDVLLSLADKEKIALQADPQFFSYLWLESTPLAVKQYAWCAFLEHCVRTEQWDLCEQHLSLLQQTYPLLFLPEEYQAMLDGLEAHAAFKLKNPRLAGWLSLFPGLGQLYAHDVKDALNAFVLDGTLIALCVYSLWHWQFWDFSVLEISPTIRFYRGNLYNAQKDTYAYNAKKTEAIQQPMVFALRAARSRISEHVFASPQ